MPVGRFLTDHQTGLAVAGGQLRDLLVRYPWAPSVVGAAIDVLLASRAHRRGHDVRAMIFAGDAGYKVASALRAVSDKAAADRRRALGLDDESTWRGPRRSPRFLAG